MPLAPNPYEHAATLAAALEAFARLYPESRIADPVGLVAEAAASPGGLPGSWLAAKAGIFRDGDLAFAVAYTDPETAQERERRKARLRG